MMIIPISDVFSQTLQVYIGGESIQIALYQKSTGFFCDVSINEDLVLSGVMCQNKNQIIRSAYLGFPGDLAFYDLQGTLDPSSPGLGTRFVLVYLEPSDLAS